MRVVCSARTSPVLPGKLEIDIAVVMTASKFGNDAHIIADDPATLRALAAHILASADACEQSWDEAVQAARASRKTAEAAE
jgi:hypothetical protein